MAETLRHRLADIQAATSIADLVIGNPHILESGETQSLIIELCDEHFLACEANHPKNPLTELRTLDWTRVSRLKIIQIGSENGQ